MLPTWAGASYPPSHPYRDRLPPAGKAGQTPAGQRKTASGLCLQRYVHANKRQASVGKTLDSAATHLLAGRGLTLSSRTAAEPSRTACEANAQGILKRRANVSSFANLFFILSDANSGALSPAEEVAQGGSKDRRGGGRRLRRTSVRLKCPLMATMPHVGENLTADGVTTQCTSMSWRRCSHAVLLPGPNSNSSASCAIDWGGCFV